MVNTLVTEMLKLAPPPQQAVALLATMRACNAAATRAAEVAFEHRRPRRSVPQSAAPGPVAVDGHEVRKAAAAKTAA